MCVPHRHLLFSVLVPAEVRIWRPRPPSHWLCYVVLLCIWDNDRFCIHEVWMTSLAANLTVLGQGMGSDSCACYWKVTGSNPMACVCVCIPYNSVRPMCDLFTPKFSPRALDAFQSAKHCSHLCLFHIVELYRVLWKRRSSYASVFVAKYSVIDA